MRQLCHASFQERKPAIPHEAPHKFVPFGGGGGQRLDGKSKTDIQQSKQPLKPDNKDNPVFIPDYNYKPGQLHFVRNYKRHDKTMEENGLAKEKEKSSFIPFSGSGKTLRDRR